MEQRAVERERVNTDASVGLDLPAHSVREKPVSTSSHGWLSVVDAQVLYIDQDISLCGNIYQTLILASW